MSTPLVPNTKQARWQRLVAAITERLDPDLPGMMIQPEADSVINDGCGYDQGLMDDRPDFVKDDDREVRRQR